MSASKFSGWIREMSELERYLAPVRISHFAVASETGDVALTPAWFDFKDGSVRVTISPASRKARLLRTNPQATVVVDDGLQRVRGVSIAGRVIVTEEDHDEVLRAHCVRYSTARAQAEDLMAAFEGEAGLVAHLNPERVRSWDEGA